MSQFPQTETSHHVDLPSKATAVASRAFYSPPLSKIVSGPKFTVLERELGLSVSERGQPRARRLVLRDDPRLSRPPPASLLRSYGRCVFPTLNTCPTSDAASQC